MLMCKILNVSRSGYYDWLKRAPSKQVIANAQLDQKIKTLYVDNKMRYGAPRITKALNKLG